MKIIIEDRDDYILQVRAARNALRDGITEGDLWGISFEDGSHYGVKRNKNSVRVYPQ
jgi:lipid II:glycine glycyltransferase (peptidoglycan interpeptide bridge formation enzyme)